MTKEEETRKRDIYNRAAVERAGDYHASRYPGLVMGAEIPKALMGGGRMGFIGVVDDIRDQIEPDKQYSPRLIVPMLNGEDVELPGDRRKREARRAQKAAETPRSKVKDISSLL